jgi:microcystin degradation protein MlrC
VRVAIGEFHHETNTFCAATTGIEQFKAAPVYNDAGWCFGDEVLEVARGARTVLGAYVDEASERGWELVPLVAVETMPSGTIEREAYEAVKNGMLERLEAAGPVDGLLLDLHGAAMVEGLDDAEADLLAALRDAVGDAVPILAVLDLHANVTAAMVALADVLVGFDTEPHRDVYERGREAAALFARIAAGEIRPTAAWVHPPMILPAINTSTDEGPMHELMALAATLEQRPRLLDVSVFAGFYGSDQADAGASVVVTTDDDDELARALAAEVAQGLWERREAFLEPLTPVAEAVATARREGGLWAFIDEADDPLGGGPGDGTAVLREVIAAGIERAGICALCDPEMVARAFAAGEGATIEGDVGGKTDALHGPPLPVRARVLSLRADPLPYAYWDPTITQDVGRIAVLDAGGVIIPVTELKAGTEAMDIFTHLGIDLGELQVIVLKGLGHTIRGVYGDLPRGYVEVESEGINHPDLRRIGTYRALRRPCFPLDEDAEFGPAEPGKESA